MILQSLCEFYQRAAQNPTQQIIEPGYALANASAELVLRENGDLVAVNSLLIAKGKKQVPRLLLVPQLPKRSGRRPEPAFLYEKVEFLFGIADEEDAAQYRFQASQKRHQEVLGDWDDPGVYAILRFFEKRTFGKVEWAGVDTTLLKDPHIFVVFRLEGDSCFLHERPVIRAAWDEFNRRREEDLPHVQCLVTGKMEPLAVLHGNVAGFGVDKPTLVTFNQASFCSFGMTGQQGANAPVGRRAAFEYVTALNILCRDPRHNINLGDEKILFWSKGEENEAEDAVSFLLGNRVQAEAEEKTERSIPESTVSRIQAMLRSIKDGGEVDQYGMDPGAEFYLLGLSSNKTRLVIRFFYECSFGALIDLLLDHYKQLEIEGLANLFPAPQSLLLAGAVQRDSANIQPGMESALMRSILEGSPYPQSLYQAVLRRIRAERKVSPLRAAIIKATINRSQKREVIKVSLDLNERNPAYLLGRLFALLEQAQRAAMGKLGANITDKYLNSAMASPNMVFPMLLALNRKHLSKLARTNDKAGLASFYEAEIAAVMDALSVKHDAVGSIVFPNFMGASDQGLFIVGYYQQKQYIFRPKSEKVASESAEVH